MEANSSSRPIALSGDRVYVFEDVAIDLTGLPSEAFSNEPNQTESESIGSVKMPAFPNVGTAVEPTAPMKSV